MFISTIYIFKMSNYSILITPPIYLIYKLSIQLNYRKLNLSTYSNRQSSTRCEYNHTINPNISHKRNENHVFYGI